MILSNQLHRPNFDYAELLVEDVHLEIPFPTDRRGLPHVELVWHSYQLDSIAEALGVTDPEEKVAEAQRQLFGPNVDPESNLWYIRGGLGEIGNLMSHHAQALMGGPQGGDDDTYDYWPNGFNMLYQLLRDFIKLHDRREFQVDYYLGILDNVIASAVAVNGPATEWEAEFMHEQREGLRTLANELPSQ